MKYLNDLSTAQHRKLAGVGIVIVLFIASLVVRMPFLGRPFGDQHEWATAHTLMALEILQSKGAVRNLFRNIQTYPGEMNNYIRWVTTRVMTPDGVSYYTSYPPFALILTYSIFTLLSLSFTVVNVEIFNLALHGISAVFLFLFLYEFIDSGYKVSLSVIGAAYFIFLSPNLFFFHKVYSWDILWYYFWIFEIFLFYKIMKETDLYGEERITPTIILFNIINFITIFTEFQGLYFALGAGIFALIEAKNKPIYKKIAILIIVSSVLPLILVFIQNATIAGPGFYVQLMLYKLFVEYGTFGSYPQGGSAYDVIGYVRTFFSPLWPVLAAAVTAGLIRHKLKFLLKIHARQWTVLGLVLLPTLLHTLILFPDFITHEFTLLKFSIFISILLPVLISTIDRKKDICTYVSLIIVYILVLKSLIDSVGVYKIIYATQPNQDRYLKLGTTIAKTLLPKEVGFLNEYKCLNPQLIYFTKRNLKQAESAAEAKSWMIKNKRLYGKIYYVGNLCDLLKIETVTVLH